MSTLTVDSNKSMTTILNEVMLSARYLTDHVGDRTDVVLPLDVWENLLEWLENLDDRKIIQEWLPRLKVGPVASGAVKWDNIVESWDDDDAL